MELEKLALSIFKEMEKDGEPVTMAEAREMAKMEINSKELCHRYEKSDKPHVSVVRERKIDTNKQFLIGKFYSTLEEIGIIGEIQNESAITFEYKSDNYSLKLVKHRKKKN